MKSVNYQLLQFSLCEQPHSLCSGEKWGKTPSFLLANLSGGNQMCWNLPSSDIHMQINTSVLSGCLSLVCGCCCQLHFDTSSCYHHYFVLQNSQDGNFRITSPVSNGNGSCLQVWIAMHFTPSYWDYGAQVDKKLYCVFTRSDRLWHFGQSPPLGDWKVWHEPAWLPPKLLFWSPFCLPTALCILTVCLCLLLLTLRSGGEPRDTGQLNGGAGGSQVELREGEMKFPLFSRICSLCTEIILTKQVLLHHMSLRKSHTANPVLQQKSAFFSFFDPSGIKTLCGDTELLTKEAPGA